MNTPVSGQLYFQPPLQNPVLLTSHTNSVFLHSHKRPAPVTDTCPLYLNSFVVPRQNKTVNRHLFLFFFPFRLRPRLVQLTCMHGLCME